MKHILGIFHRWSKWGEAKEYTVERENQWGNYESKDVIGQERTCKVCNKVQFRIVA